MCFHPIWYKFIATLGTMGVTIVQRNVVLTHWSSQLPP